MDVSLQQQAPLPPPSGSAPISAPIMPMATSNAKPHVASVAPAASAYVAPKRAKPPRSRTRVYTIGAIVFITISVAGYFGFRSYIYGDDAPPVPVLDDLGG